MRVGQIFAGRTVYERGLMDCPLLHAGLLRCDDGVDGSQFFSNFFKDINASTIFQES
jgi:hypothetical protein